MTAPLRETKEAAEFIRKCPTTVRRMVKDNRLRAYRTHPNGRMLFKESDLLASIGIEPEPAPGGHVTTIDTSPPDLLWRNANGDYVVHEDMDEAEVDRD